MHDSQDNLLIKLDKAATFVTVGAKYYHYKHPELFYKVIRLAITESDDEICVIYEAQYGNHLTFVRPLKSWLEKVDYNGQKLDRFTLVN